MNEFIVSMLSDILVREWGSRLVPVQWFCPTPFSMLIEIVNEFIISRLSDSLVREGVADYFQFSDFVQSFFPR